MILVFAWQEQSLLFRLVSLLFNWKKNKEKKIRAYRDFNQEALNVHLANVHFDF